MTWVEWGLDTSREGRRKWALELERKFSVLSNRGFHCILTCGKKPIAPAWQVVPCSGEELKAELDDYKAAKGRWTDDDVDDIETGEYKTINIGITMGPSNLVTIDVDTKNGGTGLEDLKALLKEANMSMKEFRASAVHVESGSGNGAGHWIFRLPEEYRGKGKLRGKYGGSIDIMRGPRQIVSAFSIHPSRGTYKMINPKTNEPFKPEEVNWNTYEFDRLQDLPEQLAKVLQTKAVRKRRARSTSAKTVSLTNQLSLKAAKALVNIFHPQFRAQHHSDDRRTLIWCLQSLRSCDKFRDFFATWCDDQVAKGGKHHPWPRFALIWNSFDPDRFNCDIFEHALTAASWGPTKEEAKAQMTKVDEWKGKYMKPPTILSWDEEYEEEYVRPFTTIPAEKTTILAKAFCGRGKSTATRNELIRMRDEAYAEHRPFRMLYIVNRVKNGENAHQMLNEAFDGHVGFYQDGVARDMLLIELESLYKLTGATRYTVVVIDESESVLHQLFAPINKNIKGCVQNLTHFVREAKKVILCDAFMTERTLVFARALRPEKSIFSTCNLKPHPRRNAYEIIGWPRFVAKVIEEVRAGLVPYCVIQVKRKAKELHQKLVTEFPDLAGRCYIGERRRGDTAEELRHVNDHWLNFRWVITTLTITVGIDFTQPDHFHAPFIFATSHWCGLIRDVFQALHRVRNYTSAKMYYCLDDRYAGSRYGLSIQTIRKHVEIRNEEVVELREILNSKAKKKKFRFIDENGEEQIGRLGYIADSEAGEWFKDLEIYKIYEEAMTTANMRGTFNYFLSLLNFKTKILKENLKPVQTDEPKNEEVPAYTDVPDIEEEITKLRSTQDEGPEDHDGAAEDGLNFKDDPYIEAMRRLTALKDEHSLSKLRDLTVEEFWMAEKGFFHRIIDVEGMEKRGDNIADFWQAWNGIKKKDTRNMVFTTREVKKAANDYHEQREFKGTLNEFFISRAFKVERSYVELYGHDVLAKKWALEMLKVLAGNPKISLDSLKEPSEISLETVRALDSFIKEHELEMRDGLGMRFKNTRDEARLQESTGRELGDLGDFNLHRLNVFMAKAIGTRVSIEYKDVRKVRKDKKGRKTRVRQRVPASASLAALPYWNHILL